MKLFKLPVIAGKRETIIQSKDTEIRCEETYMYIKKLYVKETPKEPEDEFSQLEEVRYEIGATVKKSAISLISWVYSCDWESYQIEIAIGDNAAYNFNMENRDKAIDLYDNLIQWWLL